MIIEAEHAFYLALTILLEIMMPVKDGFAFRLEQERDPRLVSRQGVPASAHVTQAVTGDPIATALSR